MKLVDAPTKITLPFAALGDKFVIPVASQTGTYPNGASFADGFPLATRLDPLAGGEPPRGLDFNGIFNALSAILRYLNAGSVLPYDGTFAADSHVGGYPKGAIVLNAAATGFWFNAVDDNTTNPDGTGAAGWLPFGAAGSNASVVPSASQTLAIGSTKVIFDTTEYTTSGLVDATHNRFNATFAGKYRVSGVIALPAASAQNYAISVRKNGILARLCYQFPQVSDVDLALPFECTIACVAGDYVEVYLTASQNPSTVSVASFAQFSYLGQ